MKVAGSWLMFGDPFHIRYFSNFLKVLDNLQKVILADISDGIPWLFVFLRPYFGLEIQRCYQPLSWSFQFSFWLRRCGFHLFHYVKLCWDIQGDDLVITLDFLVLSNFATTTIFHVHRLKQCSATSVFSLRYFVYHGLRREGMPTILEFCRNLTWQLIKNI